MLRMCLTCGFLNKFLKSFRLIVHTEMTSGGCQCNSNGNISESDRFDRCSKFLNVNKNFHFDIIILKS